MRAADRKIVYLQILEHFTHFWLHFIVLVISFIYFKLQTCTQDYINQL